MKAGQVVGTHSYAQGVNRPGSIANSDHSGITATMVAPPHGAGIHDYDADYPIGRVIHRALALIPFIQGKTICLYYDIIIMIELL